MLFGGVSILDEEPGRATVITEDNCCQTLAELNYNINQGIFSRHGAVLELSKVWNKKSANNWHSIKL